MVKYILKRAKLDIDEEINGETVLDLAIRRKSEKDTESIMKHGATLRYKHICEIIRNDWGKILDIVDEEELYEILDNHIQETKKLNRKQKFNKNTINLNNSNNPDNASILDIEDIVHNVENTVRNEQRLNENNDRENDNEIREDIEEDSKDNSEEDSKDNSEEDNEYDNEYNDEEDSEDSEDSEEERKEYMYVEECIKNRAYECLKILRRRGEIVKKSIRYYIKNRSEGRILEMVGMGYMIGRIEIREIMKKGMKKIEEWLIKNEKEKLIETISEMNDEKIFRRVIERGINKYMKIGEEYLMDYMIIKGKAMLVLELIKKETKIMNRELLVWKKYDGMILLEYALYYGDLESIKYSSPI